MNITNGWLTIPENDTHFPCAFDIHAISGVGIERTLEGDFTVLYLDGVDSATQLGPRDLYPELLQLVLDYHNPNSGSEAEVATDF